jgi:carboxyl-terminal processing protease
MFPSIFTLNSNLFTHSLTRRLARSAAALLAVLSLSAGIASADQNNYLPARDEGAGWNSRPATRDLDDADSLPPHRGGGYRSNYRLDDRRFEDRPVRSDRRFDDRSPDLNGDWTPDLGNGSSRTRQNWDRNDSNRFDGNRFDSNRFDSGRDFAPQFNGRTNRPSDSDLDTFGAPNRPFSDRSRFEELPAPATIPGDRSWRDRTQPLNSLPFNNGGRNDLPFNNNWGPDLRDQLPQVAPRKKVDERPQPVELINRRYSDPAVIGFISQLDAQRGLQLYSEVLDLIQNRHLEPQSPAALVQRAQANILLALRTPAFVQANRIAANPQQLAALQQAFAGMSQQMQVTSNQQAIAAAQWSMQAAQQTVGLSPQVTVVEFIYGAVDSLDRFSAFVPPETAKLSNQQLGESVVGVGVQIEVAASAGVKVVRVLQNGPAAAAGLQKNDLIVAVNGQSLAGRTLDAVTQLITGPEGSVAVLTVQRNQMQASFNVPRRSIQVQTINDVQFVDQSAKIGYFKLDTFASASAREMEAALWQLHQQGMQGLVLDLRGDPGGLLTTAIETADMFLPSGTIVSTKGRNSQDNSLESAREEQTWKVPLVVLIDEHSASASEIFAAAIQENGRGVIVGRHSYGKGTVQTLFPLNTLNAGLRLTTARFYSPAGRPMAGEGVEPDVYVAQSTTDVGPQDQDVRTAVEVLRSGVTPGAGRGTLGSLSSR